MKIVKYSLEFETSRMYCPSTDEVIFAPDYFSSTRYIVFVFRENIK
jgi:hypothetical protein